MIKTFKYMNLAFFLLMICINVLANTLPLGQGNTGSISAKYPNLYTPAPITFSIWGVIYLLVGFFIIVQLGLFSTHPFGESLVNLIGPWFIISCIMNIGWIFSWHYDITWLSLIFMLGLLVSLLVITSNISPVMLAHETSIKSIPIPIRICMYAFDIYLGWIIAATIANVSVFLVKINWNRFGLSEEFWTIVVLFVATFLGMFFIFRARRYMTSLAIIWAFCGILINHISQNGYGGSHPFIIIATIVGIFLILIVAVSNLIMGATANT